jgi:hypothetical protein
MTRARAYLVRLLICMAAGAAQADPAVLRIGGLAFDLPVLALPALPGETIIVQVDGAAGVPYAVRFNDVGVPLRNGRVRVTAPAAPGTHVLRIDNATSSQVVNLLVQYPYDAARGGRLNGFRIDPYPREALRGLEIYQRPAGFIEVTAENQHLLVSPSYTLGEFVAKQAGGFPKYVVLRPELLVKLELIKRELRAAGTPVAKFTIMSGYRTPFYNRAIGNGEYSRHVWGGAADIFIDENPRDGRMDDLNGDGRVDIEDARWLWAFIDELERSGKLGDLVGGLGLYGPNSVRGPFVHVDVRGFPARW